MLWHRWILLLLTSQQHKMGCQRNSWQDFTKCPRQREMKDASKNFRRRLEEEFSQTWERFHDFLVKCPHNWLDKARLVHFFYRGLTTPLGSRWRCNIWRLLPHFLHFLHSPMTCNCSMSLGDYKRRSLGSTLNETSSINLPKFCQNSDVPRQ